MAFNLQYNDKGTDVSSAAENFASMMKTAKSVRENKTPKDKGVVKDSTGKPAPAPDKIKPSKPEPSKSVASKLIGIINKKGGSPTQSVSIQPQAPQPSATQIPTTQTSAPQNTDIKPPTLKQVAPNNPLTAEDSLNINIGIVQDYQQGLSKQLLGRNMQESMADMDKEIEDKNYMSLDRKNAAAMELRSAMLQAKKNKTGLNDLKLSPAADALHKSFIQKAAEKSILDNNYQNYLKTGTGLFIK